MKRVALTAAVGVAVVVVAAVYVLHARSERRDVVGSSTVEFTPFDPHVARPSAPSGVTSRRRLAWETYGYGPARLRSVGDVTLRPPFHSVWTWHGGSLLEFPPVVSDGRLFLSTFDGRFYALDARTGKAIWRYGSGRCGWSSPALTETLVIATFIGRACNEDVPGEQGEVVAFDRVRGAVRWSRTVGPTESSPLVVDGITYIGDWNGVVWALDATTGATRWTFRTDGPVKSSAALADGTVYIGSYDGHVYALKARSGRLVWRSAAQPRLGGLGHFYATPSVAYDRVYIGATDGKVYSFGAQTGRLRWSHHTGGFVYAASAVWNGLVLVGSYDGVFYALAAASGRVRWTFRAGAVISGAASVVDGFVYFSTFAHRTYALDARTGHPVWTWPDGEYSPVVTDGVRLYLTGRGRLYALAG